MFEHLDDQSEFVPDAHFRRRVTARAHTLRRRRRATLGAVACAPIVVGLLLVGPMAWDASRIQRVEVPSLGAKPAGGGIGPVDGVTRVLLVGTDAGVTPDDPGDVEGRADAVIVVTVDEPRSAVTFTSVPRDLWVGGPDGTEVKLSSLGTDPDALVGAVRDVIGAPIDHYVRIGMEGFREVADRLGGLTLEFDTPMRDRRAGFTTDGGCDRLDGARLLAYVRSRHLERLDAVTGSWVTDPTGDLGRQGRQRRAVMAAVSRLGELDVATLLDVVRQHAVVDAGLGIDTARRLRAVIDDEDAALSVVNLPVVDAAAPGGRAGLALPGAPPVSEPVPAPPRC